MADLIRLQKFFTDSGTLSRRAAEAAILAGKVRVNGKLAALGDKIDPDCDVVELDGKTVRARMDKPHRYLLLNKPRGYVTTLQDEKGRPTVVSLVADAKTRVYPVGRLDMDSEGLLLLTDDGAFTNHLTHPRHKIPRIYHVTVSPLPSKDQIERLRSPMKIDGYRLQPVKIKSLSPDVLEMTLHEGRNRQIRKMCEQVGLKVQRLQRVAIGKLRLGTLPLGKWRELTTDEVAYLLSSPTKF